MDTHAKKFESTLLVIKNISFTTKHEKLGSFRTTEFRGPLNDDEAQAWCSIPSEKQGLYKRNIPNNWRLWGNNKNQWHGWKMSRLLENYPYTRAGHSGRAWALESRTKKSDFYGWCKNIHQDYYKKYWTTRSSCNCPARFHNKEKPCKHMLNLAAWFGCFLVIVKKKLPPQILEILFAFAKGQFAPSYIHTGTIIRPRVCKHFNPTTKKWCTKEICVIEQAPKGWTGWSVKAPGCKALKEDIIYESDWCKHHIEHDSNFPEEVKEHLL